MTDAPDNRPEVDEPPAPPPEREDPPVAGLNDQILAELKRLNKGLDRMNRTRTRMRLSFWGGVTRGFGAAVGATLVFAIVFALVTRLFTVPVVGTYVRDVVDFVRQNSAATFIMGNTPTPTASKPVPGEEPDDDDADASLEN